jgi:hypothetical protein
MDHRQGITDRDDHAAKQTGQIDSNRRWPDGVTNVDVDVETEPGCCELSDESYPEAAIDVLVADDLGSRPGEIEQEAIVEFCSGNLADASGYFFGIVGEVHAGQIHVPGWSAAVISSEKDTSFEDEAVALG